MKRLLKYLFGCKHRDYSWPITDVHKETYVICWRCSQRVPYEFGTGKRSRWTDTAVAGCLFLAFNGCGAHKPLPALVAAPESKDKAPTIWFSSVGDGHDTYRQIRVCQKHGESQYAGNTNFEMICWSMKKQTFVKYAVVEQ